MTAWRVRPVTPADVPALAEIESRCFTSPWTAPMIAAELVRPVAVVGVACDPSTEAIVGYACTWHIADEAELLRIAVDPVVRRRGLGRALLDDVVRDATSRGCRQIDLEVGRANAAARALYAAVGFVEVGVRPGYYSAPVDDALLLRLVLADASPDVPEIDA